MKSSQQIHLFLECQHSRSALDPIALKYNITLPYTSTGGESILYYHLQDGYWDKKGDVDAIISFKRLRALKLNLFESFRVLKSSNPI